MSESGMGAPPTSCRAGLPPGAGPAARCRGCGGRGAGCWRALALGLILILAAGRGSAAAANLPPVLQLHAPWVLLHEDLILVPDQRRMRALELVQGLNRSSQPLAQVPLPLPSGAEQLQVQGGEVLVGRAQGYASVRLAPAIPVQGQRTLSLAYTLPWAQGWVDIPIEQETLELFVLLPHGAWALQGAGFAWRGTAPFGPLRLDVYETAAPTPGAVLPVRLLHRQSWWGKLALAVAAVALGAALLWGVVRAAGRRRRRRLQEQQMVDAAADLEVAYRLGQLSEADYRARRAELLEALQTVDQGP